MFRYRNRFPTNPINWIARAAARTPLELNVSESFWVGTSGFAGRGLDAAFSLATYDRRGMTAPLSYSRRSTGNRGRSAEGVSDVLGRSSDVAPPR